MTTEFSTLSAWFWDDTFWLPPNVTWSSLKSREPEVTYASFSDLAYPLALAWVILLVRKIVERFVFRPLGQKLGMKEQRKQLQAPKELLKERKRNGGAAIDHAEERSVERWLRQKKLVGRPSKLDKFSETGWRWLYYTNIFGFGLVSRFSKPYTKYFMKHLCWIPGTARHYFIIQSIVK